MHSTVEPTRDVRCVYTTVLSSKATRYFAIAPTAKYEKILSAQLRRDVTTVVSANTAGAACCSTAHNSTILVNDSSARSANPCVCLKNTTLLEINRRFVDQTSLLGLTFEVHYDVYEYKDGRLITANTSSNTATATATTLPFTWSWSRRDAFPNIVSNLFRALTRKVYLSELTAAVNVFAHVTIEEVELMLRSHYDKDGGDSDGSKGNTTDAVAPVMDENTETRVKEVSTTTSAVAVVQYPVPKAQQRVNAISTLDTASVDYCTLLRGTLSPAYTTPPVMVSFNATSLDAKSNKEMGAEVRYTYPYVVVKTSHTYVTDTSSQCRGVMCSLGTLCGVLIVILILAAGVAFVMQHCRRRRNEREDERRLMQRQMR